MEHWVTLLWWSAVVMVPLGGLIGLLVVRPWSPATRVPLGTGMAAGLVAMLGGLILSWQRFGGGAIVIRDGWEWKGAAIGAGMFVFAGLAGWASTVYLMGVRHWTRGKVDQPGHISTVQIAVASAIILGLLLVYTRSAAWFEAARGNDQDGDDTNPAVTDDDPAHP